MEILKQVMLWRFFVDKIFGINVGGVKMEPFVYILNLVWLYLAKSISSVWEIIGNPTSLLSNTSFQQVMPNN